MIFEQFFQRLIVHFPWEHNEKLSLNALVAASLVKHSPQLLHTKRLVSLKGAPTPLERDGPPSFPPAGAASIIKQPPAITNTSVLVIRRSVQKPCPTKGHTFQCSRSHSKDKRWGWKRGGLVTFGGCGKCSLSSISNWFWSWVAIYYQRRDTFQSSLRWAGICLLWTAQPKNARATDALLQL